MDQNVFFALAVLLLAVFSPSVFGGSGSQEVDGVEQCYACSDQTSNYYCRRDEDKQGCSSGQYCQTVIENNDGQLEISKGCKKAKDCDKDQDKNDDLCDDGLVKSKCRYCCGDELCNEGVERYHEPYDDCGPWSGWSSCIECRRRRSRQCGGDDCSKSKSKSCSGGSGSKNSRRRRGDGDVSEEENNAMEVEDAIVAKKHPSSSSSSSSSSGSKEETTEYEEDNCCRTSCYDCNAVSVDFSWTYETFRGILDGHCSIISCGADQPLCQTIYVFDEEGKPTMSRGCTSSPACKSYEDSDVCPIMVTDDQESAYVGYYKAGPGTKCSYCCDNGVDDHGIICNSGLIPPAKYLSDGTSFISGSFVAVVTMVIAASIVSM